MKVHNHDYSGSQVKAIGLTLPSAGGAVSTVVHEAK